MRSLAVTLRAVSSRAGLRRVLSAYALYDFVEFSIWLAILLYAYAVGGAALAGFAAVVQLVPAAAVAPMLAGVGDRMPRGTALVITHGAVAITAALTLMTLLANAPVAGVLVAATLTTTAVAVVRPIHFAALPQIAHTREELVSANSLSSAADGVAYFAGPAIAGVLVAASGPWLVCLIGVVASTTAALLCLGLGLEPGHERLEGDEAGGWRAAFEGLHALRGDWGSIALLLVLATNFVLVGAMDVLGVAYASEVLGLGDTGAGLVVGAAGVGALFGAAVAAALSVRRHLAAVIIAGGCLQGLGVAVVAAIGGLGPAMVALAVSGVGATVLMVSGRTLLQRSTDDHVLARVFAVQEGTSLLGLAIGAALAPVMISWLSPSEAFLPFGLGACVLTLAGVFAVRRLDQRSVVPTREVELLRGVRFLNVLPPYELERLARNATWLDVRAGTEVVCQGGIGDTFYVIDSGEFSVTVDGTVLDGLLGPGDFFGEIALLIGSPRTATVTAVALGRVLLVTAEAFLAAVTGSVDGQAIAAQVVEARLRHNERVVAYRGESPSGEGDEVDA
jgi:MFS family permease